MAELAAINCPDFYDNADSECLIDLKLLKQHTAMKLIVLLLSSILFVSCVSKSNDYTKDDIEPAAEAFLSHGWINKYIDKGQHALFPAPCFQDIKKTVPKKWWRFAIEGLYYQLPEKPDDGSIDTWLTTADSILLDTNVHAFVQLIFGLRLCSSGKYDDALVRLQESYQLSQLSGQLFRANDARRYMARCYLLKGEYPTAVEILNEVFEFLKDKSDHFHEVRKFETMLQLSYVYNSCSEYEKALYWIKKALHYVRQFDHPGQEVIAEESMATIFLNLNMPDSAFLLLKKAQTQRLAFQIKHDTASGQYLLGKTLFMLGRCQEALPMLKRAESGNLENANGLKIAEIKTAIADCMQLLGSSDSAMHYYRQALTLSPVQSDQAKIHRKIAELCARRGQYQQALNHHQMGARCFSDFFSPEKDRALGKIEAYSTLDYPKKRLEKLKKSHNNQRFLLVFLGCSLFIGSGVVLILLRRQHQKRRDLKNQQVVQQQHLERVSASLNQKDAELSEAQHLLALKNQLIQALEQKMGSSTLDAPMRMLTKKDWLAFQQSFETQFPDFIARLRARFVQITSTDIRLFILIKIGLDSRCIAAISGISVESVYRGRTRLRKKLGLDNSENLENFIELF
jgi:tetratricopeptide (TPR) repeat protein/DNA-binding CsgD family transcriptional regulator